MSSLKDIWFETDAASGGFERDDIVIKIHIPANVYVGFDKEAVARRLYELIAEEPMALEAAPVVVKDGVIDVHLPNIPKDWYVWWCTECNYSVTVAYEDMSDLYDDPDWRNDVEAALLHDH